MKLLAFVFCIGLALACGGGGGGGGSSSLSPENGIMATQFKAGQLYKVQKGDRLVISELGSGIVTLNQVLSSESDVISVELDSKKDYVMAIYTFDIPAWRTTILSSQLQQALNNNGIVDLGELNAMTTLVTGVFETELNASGLRSKTGRTKTLAENLLEKWFGAGVTNMSQLRYNGTLPKGTAQFEPWQNRLALLSFYMEWLGGLQTQPSTTEAQAMSNLYGALFDANNTADLVAALASPALPPKPTDTQALTQKLSQQAMIYSGPGLLSPTHLITVFLEPTKALGLLQMTLSPPKGQLLGQILGAQGDNIELFAQHDTFPEVNTTVSTDSQGRFVLSGMTEGSWSLTPRNKNLLFQPPMVRVTLQKNEALSGFDFTSFTYGSSNVPSAETVLQGISYTSSNGQLTLTGSLILPATSSVLNGVSFGPGGNLLGSLDVSASANASTPAVMTAHLLGAAQKSSSSLGSFSVRH